MLGIQFQGLGPHMGMLFLRVGFGTLMLAGHGMGKLEALLAGQGRSGPFGMEGLLPQALITSAEFGCSILIIFGFATRLAAIPLVIGMATAFLWGHAGDPFFPVRTPVLTAAGDTVRVTSAAKELAMLYFFAFGTVLFAGPGKFSLDAVIGRFLRNTSKAPGEVTQGVA